MEYATKNIYTRLKRALRARRRLRNDIIGLCFLCLLDLPAALLQTVQGVGVVGNGGLYMPWQRRKKGSEAT